MQTEQPMATRRILRSVLHNFLGTYTSRYSDYEGYWLFGFLVANLDKLQVDLLANVKPADSTVEFARRLAVENFAKQLCKSGLNPSWVGEAFLQIERLDGEVEDCVNGHQCNGFNVRFRASATTDTGKVFECEYQLFVAPHDPRIEFQSA